MYSEGAERAGARPRAEGLLRRESGRYRDQGLLADRKGPNDKGLSRKHLFDAIDKLTRHLGVDYVDSIRFTDSIPIHRSPKPSKRFTDIVKAGKARYIGASSMVRVAVRQVLYTADRHGWTRFVSMQNHYNLVYREEEREMLPLCLEERIGVIPWSPLARGFLAGNRRKADWG